MNKLFVYGIFLGQGMRDSYYMSNPEYAVVHGYKTVALDIAGSDIVEAVPDESSDLTGLLVDVAPYVNTGFKLRNNWERLDALEHGYDRVKVTTTLGDRAWMYVQKGNRDEQE